MAYAFTRRESCPACGRPDGRQLLDLPFDAPPISDYLDTFYSSRVSPGTLTAGRYVLVECSACSLVYQRDVPGPELLELVYDDAVPVTPEAGRSARGLNERRQYAFQVEQMLKYFGRHPADVAVLDYGMGWGNWLQMAQAYGCRASGSELSSARAEAPAPGVEVIPPDEIPQARFDFVNTEQVFEHLTEPWETGQVLAGALRPGGILRISVPNGSAISELLGSPDWTAPKGSARSLNAVAPLEHVNCFSHTALVRFGERLGLTPMHYPVRQFLDPWERMRFAASALVHSVRRPKGTMLLFAKPTQ
ncbi:MAG: methyltransferase domain-containing protein [Acidimicrobiia bacterium]